MLSAENERTPAPSRLELPTAPAEQADRPVAAWVQPLTIDTYLPLEPDPLPAFLDSRVYQGSSGRVFPLPFHERISQTKHPHEWNAVHLQNRYVRVMMLPELGGRVHLAYDRVGDYDFVYRNTVIKPALVGLAGPWVSGGIEFNWPQHHRPATFLPTDFELEHESDGSVTAWFSDHDPFTRMKGMHGIRLRPESSVVEARVRLVNRTDVPQTFLWWANVAAAVNDDYQSFFPTDVDHVADHAKRAIATFPAVDGSYYGVDYPARVTDAAPDADRIDWYRNIPVPTSYMVTRTSSGFFGGYDHGRSAGFVHWADPQISPGKKQWTWGNAPFGWAWDANLTDSDGPYVELMAGVYTDNQPDFAWLAPGETKAFSQYWYPIREIGPAMEATRRAAIRVQVQASFVTVGIVVTEPAPSARMIISHLDGTVLLDEFVEVTVERPLVLERRVEGAIAASELVVSVSSAGEELVAWRAPDAAPDPIEPATEPPAPADIAGQEELYLTGQWLQQFRHATRMPEPYWLEALRRDPDDARCNVALAGRLSWAARFDEAEVLLRRAVARLTARVPSPADGEAHYRLGLLLAQTERDDEAREPLAKAAWTAAWTAPALLALARIHARAAQDRDAIRCLEVALRHDADNLQARDLLALVLRRVGRDDEADALLAETLALDPLDQWARDLARREPTTDAPTLLDVALEYAEAGAFDDALRVFDATALAAEQTALGQVQVGPLAHYHRAAILDALGRVDEAMAAHDAALATDPLHAAALRIADVKVLEAARRRRPDDALAALLLGDWYYDRRRPTDAIEAWSTALDAVVAGQQRAAGRLGAAGQQGAPGQQGAAGQHGAAGQEGAAGQHGAAGRLGAAAARNLGIAAYNALHDAPLARARYEVALSFDPRSAKLLYEQDQLAARVGESQPDRLARLGSLATLVAERDDLTIVYAGLLTAADREDEAVELLSSRRFQPWEGGEGLVLDAWEQAHAAVAVRALRAGDASAAVEAVESALQAPASLGEARHPLANTAGLHLLLGDALAAAGLDADAGVAWTRAASFTGDFLGMSPRPFSDESLNSVVALRRLGREHEALTLYDRILAWVDEYEAAPAKIDFFATSLPTMLLFVDDPRIAHQAEIRALREHVTAIGNDAASHH